ncbi:MAG: response regulator [Myxococcaceae bacterium]
MADLLIVDDDIEGAEALADVVRAEGHRVRLAHNGAEGLLQMKARKPELILLDVEMPKVSGPQMALEAFLHDCGLEEVPIILLSGVTNLPQVAAGVGTPYFLAKPYRYEELTGMLARALLERAAPRRP